MAMNKDSFNKMPPEVQKIIKDVGLEYSKTLGNTLMQRYEAALKSIQTQGATQSVPVKVAPMAPGEREKWASTMPNIAADWVKSNASRGPSALIVKTYMEELRKRGAKPLRDWDKGL
jgi:TRAP-type transport system periplasmic protein